MRSSAIAPLIVLFATVYLPACDGGGSGDGAETEGATDGADANDDDDDDDSDDDDDTSPATSASGPSSTTGTSSDPDTSGTTDGPDDSNDSDDTSDIPELSPGCGMPLTTDWLGPHQLPGGQTTQRGTVDAAGTEREFLIDLPEDYDPRQAYPFVFTFHGLGGNMSNAFGQNVDDYWPEDVIAVYPQGLDGSWSYSTGGPDVALITSIINEVGIRMCVDMQRIFVQGTSAGGAMSNFVACVLGDLIAGAAPAASWFPVGSDVCEGPVPLFMVHGSADNVVSLGQGSAARDTWLQLNGCSGDPTAFDPAPCVTYTCEHAPVVWCEHGGGHDQPNVIGLADALHGFFASLP